MEKLKALFLKLEEYTKKHPLLMGIIASIIGGIIILLFTRNNNGSSSSNNTQLASAATPVSSDNSGVLTPNYDGGYDIPSTPDLPSGVVTLPSPYTNDGGGSGGLSYGDMSNIGGLFSGLNGLSDSSSSYDGMNVSPTNHINLANLAFGLLTNPLGTVKGLVIGNIKNSLFGQKQKAVYASDAYAAMNPVENLDSMWSESVNKYAALNPSWAASVGLTPVSNNWGSNGVSLGGTGIGGISTGGVDDGGNYGGVNSGVGDVDDGGNYGGFDGGIGSSHSSTDGGSDSGGGDSGGGDSSGGGGEGGGMGGGVGGGSGGGGEGGDGGDGGNGFGGGFGDGGMGSGGW